MPILYQFNDKDLFSVVNEKLRQVSGSILA